MNLDFRLFKGASIKFSDPATSADKANDLSKMAGIKKVYNLQTYPMPKPDILWTGNSAQKLADLKKRADADTFSTHKMTQVDKLRAEGITGKGIKIAVVDTGVSNPAS